MYSAHLSGLRQDIRRFVQARVPKDIKAAIAAAQNEECSLALMAGVNAIILVATPRRARAGAGRQPARAAQNRGYGAQNRDVNVRSSEQQTNKRNVVCYYCSNKGHYIAERRIKQRDEVQQGNGANYYK